MFFNEIMSMSPKMQPLVKTNFYLIEQTINKSPHQLLTRVYKGPRAGEGHSHLRTLNSSQHLNPAQPRTPP